MTIPSHQNPQSQDTLRFTIPPLKPPGVVTDYCTGETTPSTPQSGEYRPLRREDYVVRNFEPLPIRRRSQSSSHGNIRHRRARLEIDHYEPPSRQGISRDPCQLNRSRPMDWDAVPRQPQSDRRDEFGRMKRDDNLLLVGREYFERDDSPRGENRRDGRDYGRRYGREERDYLRSWCNTRDDSRRSRREVRGSQVNIDKGTTLSLSPSQGDVQTHANTTTTTNQNEILYTTPDSTKLKDLSSSLYQGLSEDILMRGVDVLSTLLPHINYFTLDDVAGSNATTEWQSLALEITAPLWGEKTWSEVTGILLKYFHSRRGRPRAMRARERNLSKALDRYIMAQDTPRAWKYNTANS